VAEPWVRRVIGAAAIVVVLAASGCGGSLVRINGNGQAVVESEDRDRLCSAVNGFQIWIFSSNKSAKADTAEKQRIITGLRVAGKDLSDALPQFETQVAVIIDDQRQKLLAAPVPSGANRPTAPDSYKAVTQYLATNCPSAKPAPAVS
jgi:hypothetical protein